MDLPPGLITSVGIPGAVILALVGVLLRIVSKIVDGRLVPLRYYDDALKSIANYQAANEKLTEALRELSTDKDLGLHILQAIRASAQAERGDNP